ncbi:hypothetical protein TWF718_010901 [Orbilia javanica]|uniref:Uncharacterized protein n=1 Tax=Orbilia javanica TaxID=47235 RepID=A0AAN8RK73_9PEZI
MTTESPPSLAASVVKGFPDLIMLPATNEVVRSPWLKDLKGPGLTGLEDPDALMSLSFFASPATSQGDSLASGFPINTANLDPELMVQDLNMQILQAQTEFEKIWFDVHRRVSTVFDVCRKFAAGANGGRV